MFYHFLKKVEQRSVGGSCLALAFGLLVHLALLENVSCDFSHYYYYYCLYIVMIFIICTIVVMIVVFIRSSACSKCFMDYLCVGQGA